MAKRKLSKFAVPVMGVAMAMGCGNSDKTAQTQPLNTKIGIFNMAIPGDRTNPGILVDEDGDGFVDFITTYHGISGVTEILFMKPNYTPKLQRFAADLSHQSTKPEFLRGDLADKANLALGYQIEVNYSPEFFHRR